MAASLVGSWSTYTTDSLPSGTSAPGAGSNRKLVHILIMEKAGEQTVTGFTVGGQTYTESHNYFLESGGAGDHQIMVFIWDEAAITAMSGSTISFSGISTGTQISWAYATISGTDQTDCGFSSAGSVSADSLPVSVTSTANDYMVGMMIAGSANRAPLDDDVLTEVDEYSVSGMATRLSAGVGGSSPVTFVTDQVANNTMAAALLVFKDPTSGPVLTSPTDTSTGTTSADMEVTTDTSTGTIYWVVTQSSTTPSHAQIAAGDDHTDTAADAAGSSITNGGVESFSTSSLVASTQYYTHFTHEATLNSTPVSASGFVTDGATPTLSSPTLTKTGSSTATGTVTSDTAGGSIEGVITTSATTPSSTQILAGQDHTGAAAVDSDSFTAASGVNNFSWTGLAPNTVYYAHYGQAGSTPATPVTSASATTDANQAPVLDSPIPDQVCTIGVAFGPLDVSVYFSDPDADTLTFSATGLPVGLTISSAGVISGTPTGGYNS